MPPALTPPCDPDDNPDDQIERILNDAKRKELEARFGAQFVRVGKGRLPPEIEGEFLDYIAEFHHQLQNAEEVPVRQFIGFPEVRAVADLPESEVESEIERLLDHLNRNEIFVDFPDHVEAPEAYRFLVEELLDAKITDIRIPGMRFHFLYDEFER